MGSTATIRQVIFKSKAALCVLLVLNLHAWIAGCTGPAGIAAPLTGILRVELSADHALTKALNNSVLIGAEAFEIRRGERLAVEAGDPVLDRDHAHPRGRREAVDLAPRPRERAAVAGDAGEGTDRHLDLDDDGLGVDVETRLSGEVGGRDRVSVRVHARSVGDVRGRRMGDDPGAILARDDRGRGARGSRSQEHHGQEKKEQRKWGRCGAAHPPCSRGALNEALGSARRSLDM